MSRNSTPKGKRLAAKDGSTVVAAKNANGAGSIYWDRANNTYKATFIDPATGKRRTVSAKTKAEAERKRAAKLDELAAKSNVGPMGEQPTIADMCARFLDYTDVSPATHVTYQNHCKRITDAMGSTPIADLDVATVEEFLKSLRDAGLSGDTIRNHRARLKQVAEEAVNLDYLASNPVSRVKAPKPRVNTKRPPKRALTTDETKALLSAARHQPLGAAVAMLYTMGNRSAEVLGLAWSDVDLDAKTATVVRSSVYAGKGTDKTRQTVGQHLGPPKTIETAGVHSLPDFLVGLLREHKAAQNAEKLRLADVWQNPTYQGRELEMVFAGPRGGLLLRHRLYDAVQECCALAGIDSSGIGTHTGRRTVVTALYGAGLDLSDIARHVGHTDTSTTAGYVRGTGTRPQDTAAKAAALLTPDAE